jgi:phenylpropionate dioxygenase-like ring-hydroxylating dioxygenase large terminal subunit
MFKFNSSDYRNYVYGIIPKNYLRRKKMHPFQLWGQDLILFWNGGDVSCFKNACPHYGLPLSAGRVREDEVECGFHSWRFHLTDGKLVQAPLAKKQPTCKLIPYKAFIRGGTVFVYTGEDSGFEDAKSFIMEEVFEYPQSAFTIYEVPFYLAMNSSMDFPHHANHTLFYNLYGIYRKLSFKSNPLRTTFTPIMQEETNHFFKYQNQETSCETTVFPFCSQYDDPVAKTSWQFFVSPIDNVTSQYLISVKSLSRNPLYSLLIYLAFHTVIKLLAMPEDQKWLKSSYKNFRKEENINLCDHDFGLKNYLRKFFKHPSKEKK